MAFVDLAVLCYKIRSLYYSRTSGVLSIKRRRFLGYTFLLGGHVRHFIPRLARDITRNRGNLLNIGYYSLHI